MLFYGAKFSSIDIMQSLEELKNEALTAVRTAPSLLSLREVEVRYLGRSGKVTAILRQLKDLAPEVRKERGGEANELRKTLELEIAATRTRLENIAGGEGLKSAWIDVTRPGVKLWRGGLHPLSILQREIVQIFSSLGFEVADGPEIETEWYNFDALNIPADHPSRDMWDTFWLRQEVPNPKSQTPSSGFTENPRQSRDKSQVSNFKSQKLLLRTHTSPVQVRYMETHRPPFRIIVPGRVFRYEATDASHEIQFYQLEGLMVGTDVSLANFKHVITEFFARLFDTKVTVRLRPSYFPFVEPGVEVDMSCVQCAGDGCAVCKRTGWLEMAGAGMVHPNVFRAAGVSPKDWQGFAFGFGIDRIAMMKYKIPDIRLFYSSDIRFLRQF